MWDPFDGFPFSHGALYFPRSSSYLSFPLDTSAFANASIDWKETPEARVFKVDLPGNENNEVKLEVEDGNTVQTAKIRKRTDTWYTDERNCSKFLRRFILSENVKIDTIRTAMENGLLIVTVPKEEIKKTAIKSIKISG